MRHTRRMCARARKRVALIGALTVLLPVVVLLVSSALANARRWILMGMLAKSDLYWVR
jgi:cell division protein FtsW (lipid II flippase)